MFRGNLFILKYPIQNNNNQQPIKHNNMKKLILLLLIVASIIYGCQPSEEKCNMYIQHFFESQAQFTCADSTKGIVQLRFLNISLNMETMSFEFNIPDSIEYSDFFNAYTGRIVDAYYKSRDVDSTKLIDSLYISQSCNCDEVRKNIIKHYCNDRVFTGIFKAALSSFYTNKERVTEHNEISEIEKIDFEIDSLIQIALLQFDIVKYDPEKGFAFHFVCGVNPFDYNYENRERFLIPGFCQEALRNKEMYTATKKIISYLTEKAREDNGEEIRNVDEVCNKYEKELYRLLLEEGTLKNSLLEYYEERKDIEPFRIKY